MRGDSDFSEYQLLDIEDIETKDNQNKNDQN